MHWYCAGQHDQTEPDQQSFVFGHMLFLQVMGAGVPRGGGHIAVS